MRDIRHLGQLLRYSLVEYNDVRQRYGLHNLVRVFAAMRSDDMGGTEERSGAGGRYAEHFVRVLAATRNLYLAGGNKVDLALTLFDCERHNIEAGQRWASSGLSKDSMAARLASGYARCSEFVLHLRHHPEERIRWQRAGLAAAQRLSDRKAEGDHVCELGLAYADLGDLRQAIAHYDECLGIYREIGDRQGESTGTGQSWQRECTSRESPGSH